MSTRESSNSNDACYRLYSDKPMKRGLQNVINENYENQPCAARALCPASERALCCVAALCCKDLYVFKTMDHLSVLVHNTDTEKCTLEKLCHERENNAAAKACGIPQKCGPTISRGRFSKINTLREKRGVRTIVKQRHAIILRTSHSLCATISPLCVVNNCVQRKRHCSKSDSISHY